MQIEHQGSGYVWSGWMSPTHLLGADNPIKIQSRMQYADRASERGGGRQGAASLARRQPLHTHTRPCAYMSCQ